MKRHLKDLARGIDRYGAGFLAYVGVAFASAVSEWLSFAGALLVMAPVPASFVGFFIATGLNYGLSRFAFESKRSILVEFLLTVIMSAHAFLFNFVTFYVLYAYLGTRLMVAKVIGTAVGFVFNYLTRQFLIFAADSPFSPVSALLGAKRRSRYD